MTGSRPGFRFLAILLAALLSPSCSSDKKQPPRTRPLRPGSSRTFTLSGPLPFIHGTERSSGLEVEYGRAVSSRRYPVDISRNPDMHRGGARQDGNDILVETHNPLEFMEQGKLAVSAGYELRCD